MECTVGNLDEVCTSARILSSVVMQRGTIASSASQYGGQDEGGEVTRWMLDLSPRTHEGLWLLQQPNATVGGVFGTQHRDLTAGTPDVIQPLQRCECMQVYCYIKLAPFFAMHIRAAW